MTDQGGGVGRSNGLNRVLVLDGDMIPALTIVRSLARLGVATDVASHVERPLAGYSRHAGARLHYPDPLAREAAFLDWCASVLADGAWRLVIPVTERTLVPLQRLRDRPGADRLAMAANEALAVVLDKSRTLELAAGLGIPAPRSRLVAAPDQIAAAITGLDTPVVIKPARSIGENSAGRRQLSVDYAFTPRELETKAAHRLRYGPVLLQEYFAGQGVGVELIADRGQVVYAFQHRRLHEVPLTGGGSSLRVSVPVLPPLLEASKRLMQALAWHGVAMVEFKWNPDSQRFSLMEINGRFWGSLPLAVAAGADFPAMLYELLTEGAVRPRPAPVIGVHGRKLSSDLYWHEQVLRRDAPPGLVAFPDNKTLARDLLRIFQPRHAFDVQCWGDPVPGLVDLGRILHQYGRRVGHIVRDRLARRAQLNAWRSGRAARRLQSARQVLFVCYGNINRSALAERCLKGVAPAARARVVSAGFHEEEGRPADPVMVEVAGAAGIDLRGWSSRRITPELVAQSDVILVMEQRHLERMHAHFPGADGKTFLLGMAPAADSPGGEIADPYGKPRPAYERCAREVMASVRAVARCLDAA